MCYDDVQLVVAGWEGGPQPAIGLHAFGRTTETASPPAGGFHLLGAIVYARIGPHREHFKEERYAGTYSRCHCLALRQR